MLRGRDFRFWLLGTTADSLGSSLMLIVVPLAAVAVSGSTVTAGAIGTAHAATIASLLLLGGYLVDRVNRRLCMLINAIVRLTTLGACGALAVTDRLSVASLLVCIIIAAVSQGLFGSADNAALRSILDDDSVVRAQPIVQSRKALVELVGAPLGGLLLGIAMGVPFFVAGALAGILALSAMSIRSDLRPTARPAHGGLPVRDRSRETSLQQARFVARRRSYAWREFTKGIELVLRDSALRIISLLVVFVNLATGLVLNGTVLRYAAQGIEPQRISLLFLCATLGMLVGALVSSQLIKRIASGKILTFAFLWFVAAFIGAAINSTFVMMCIWLGLIGFAAPIVSSIAQGYTVVRTPPDLQGRVGSILTLFSMGVASAAPLISGVALAIWTESHIYWLAGLIAVGCVIVVLFARPVRGLGTPSEWTSSSR